MCLLGTLFCSTKSAPPRFFLAPPCASSPPSASPVLHFSFFSRLFLSTSVRFAAGTTYTNVSPHSSLAPPHFFSPFLFSRPRLAPFAFGRSCFSTVESSLLSTSCALVYIVPSHRSFPSRLSVTSTCHLLAEVSCKGGRTRAVFARALLKRQSLLETRLWLLGVHRTSFPHHNEDPFHLHSLQLPSTGTS